MNDHGDDVCVHIADISRSHDSPERRNAFESTSTMIEPNSNATDTEQGTQTGGEKDAILKSCPTVSNGRCSRQRGMSVLEYCLVIGLTGIAAVATVSVVGKKS